MGVVHVTVSVASPARPERAEEIELLVDTGAMLSVIPRAMLERLGLSPIGRRKFKGFGDQTIEREISVALLRYNGDAAGTSVIFGEEGDTPVLGVTALETLGYQVDPVSGRLNPTDLLLV